MRDGTERWRIGKGRREIVMKPNTPGLCKILFLQQRTEVADDQKKLDYDM